MGRYNNTSVRNWGYMLLITLMWLTIPAATAYFARADYQRYSIESVRQRADCEARADALSRYTGLYASHAAILQQTQDELSFRQWKFMLDSYQLEQEVERRGLRLDTPSHYPRTDAQLNLLEGQLADQLQQCAQAGSRQDQYLRAEQGLGSMTQSVAEVEAAAQYYERIGAEGIYLMLMEDLAKLEGRFRQLQQQRRQLATDRDTALRDATTLNRGVLREIKHLPDKLALDEQTTYAQALLMRLQGFNPWMELQASLNQPPPPT